MKIMFISDIHGKKTNLQFIKDKYESLGCDQLVILGDIYLSGTWDDYDRESVKDFLESFQNVICMRGNCDSRMDIEEIPFPVEEGYKEIHTDTRTLYITHGNLYNKDTWDIPNSILIYGHTHVPFILEQDNHLFVNPGSISLPRKNYHPSYLIFDEKSFKIYDIYDTILFQKNV